MDILIDCKIQLKVKSIISTVKFFNDSGTDYYGYQVSKFFVGKTVVNVLFMVNTPLNSLNGKWSCLGFISDDQILYPNLKSELIRNFISCFKNLDDEVRS